MRVVPRETANILIFALIAIYYKDKLAKKREEEERIKYVIHVAPGKGIEDYMKKISMLEKTFKGKIIIEDIPYSDEIIIYCYKKPINTPEEEIEINDVNKEINNILGGK